MMGKSLSLGLCAVALLAAVGLAVEASAQRSDWWGGDPSAPATAPPPDAGRGGRLAAEACATCHGEDGDSPDPLYPKLAGQRAGYLHRQLLAFRSGHRRSDVMADVAAALSDADMADLAAFYSRQVRRPDAVDDRELAERGRQIFKGGHQPRMPSCAMCHGASSQGHMPMMGMRPMMSMMEDAPILNGQHAGYLVDQLRQFATGERQATTMMGMMMGRAASTLTEAEARSVAEYLSGLP